MLIWFFPFHFDDIFPEINKFPRKLDNNIEDSMQICFSEIDKETFYVNLVSYRKFAMRRVSRIFYTVKESN